MTTEQDARKWKTSPKQWKAAGRFYTFRGHRIFYREAGEGPAILLLGGLPFASWTWSGVWPMLTGQLRGYALDFPGLGFSDKPKAFTYSIADLTDLADLFLRAREVDELEVWAHDLGQWVALELMHRMAVRRQSGVEYIPIRKVRFFGAGAMSIFWEKRPLFFQKKILKNRLYRKVPTVLQTVTAHFISHTHADQKLPAFQKHFNSGHEQMQRLAAQMKEVDMPLNYPGAWPAGLFTENYDVLLREDLHLF